MGKKLPQKGQNKVKLPFKVAKKPKIANPVFNFLVGSNPEYGRMRAVSDIKK